MSSLIFLLLFNGSALCAQLSNAEVDRIMSRIPKSRTNNIYNIASFIQEKFNSDSNKLRAIFFFTANHIDYDVDNMYAVNFNEKTENKIEKVLHQRIGVCIHYSEVFNALSKELVIESYVIEGMTKQNGQIDPMAHAWNAAKLAGKWYLFDATWGAGSVSQGKFIKKLDNNYYQVKPEKLVKSHYPFDYLWQFTNRPLKANDFLYGRPSSYKQKIDYESTLKNLKKLSDLEKLNEAIVRIEANGLIHEIIFDRYNHLKQSSTIISYNGAVADYNEGVKKFKEYINFRNAQFTPNRTDSELAQMIKAPKQFAEQASIKLQSIRNPDISLGINPAGLITSVANLEKNIQEQSQFVDTYIQTKPNKRKSMFYSKEVTIFGVPSTK